MGKPVLEARGLRAWAGGSAVVEGVDLALGPGEVAWIGGASGAGKTTMLRALARLGPWEGRLLLRGEDAARIPAHRWRARVVLAPFPPVALGATVAEDLRAPWRLRVRRGGPVPDDGALERELGLLGLGEIGLGRPTAELSQGQLGRLALARALLARPEVLLLDEPAANLDPEAAERVAERLGRFAREGGVAVVAGHGEPWPGVTRRFRIAGGRLEALP
ncbi:ABC transporter ATP-binding protein [Deferrisoma palaeochoriense]